MASAALVLCGALIKNTSLRLDQRAIRDARKGIGLQSKLAVLAGAITLFVAEKSPADIAAIPVLVSLLLAGVTTPLQAMSEFSGPMAIAAGHVRPRCRLAEERRI